MKSQCHLTVPSENSRMMIGAGGEYKNGVMKECNVDVEPDGDGDDGDISAMFAARKKKVNSEESYVNVSVESPESVLKDYFSMKLEDLNLKFWSKYQDKKKERYSRALFRLAKKYLTPPPTSTNVERLFSTASLISEKRPWLLPENLEKLLFLRENLNKKSIVIDY